MCPWCGKPSVKKLCADCYMVALSIASLPHERLDDLPFGIIELDSDGNILDFNHAEEERSHLSASDVIGRNFFRDVAPCTRVKEYEGRFKEFLTSDEPTTQFSFIYYLPHGRIRIYLVLIRAQGQNVLIVSKER